MQTGFNNFATSIYSQFVLKNDEKLSIQKVKRLHLDKAIKVLKVSCSSVASSFWRYCLIFVTYVITFFLFFFASLFLCFALSLLLCLLFHLFIT